MVGWYTHNINCCKHFILCNQKTIVYTSMAVVGVPARVSLLPSLQWADSLQLLHLQYSLQSHSPQWLNMARVLDGARLLVPHAWLLPRVIFILGPPLAWWDSRSCVAFWGSLSWTLCFLSVLIDGWPTPQSEALLGHICSSCSIFYLFPFPSLPETLVILPQYLLSRKPELMHPYPLAIHHESFVK